MNCCHSNRIHPLTGEMIIMKSGYPKDPTTTLDALLTIISRMTDDEINRLTAFAERLYIQRNALPPAAPLQSTD